MTISIRLDTKTERVLVRMARATGRTKSAVVREAIRRLAEQTDGKSATGTVYDRLADVIGIVRLGPDDRASRAEEILKAQFASRRAIR